MRPCVVSMTTLLFLLKFNPKIGPVNFFITTKFSANMLSPISNLSAPVGNGYSSWPFATCIWKLGGLSILRLLFGLFVLLCPTHSGQLHWHRLLSLPRDLLLGYSTDKEIGRWAGGQPVRQRCQLYSAEKQANLFLCWVLKYRGTTCPVALGLSVSRRLTSTEILATCLGLKAKGSPATDVAYPTETISSSNENISLTMYLYYISVHVCSWLVYAVGSKQNLMNFFRKELT